jgi:MFS family permease
MSSVIRTTWPLLLGMFLLMLGNGMQGTLLGVRGAIEGFSAGQMSLVMSGYFLGFLVSSRTTPLLIRRVGHVRVFAAMGSVISAVFILYAEFPQVWAWGLMRVVVGACFAAVYVVAESWLNDGATNETRGQTLSAYMIIQMLGIIAAQGAMNLSDPGGYSLFVLISVLVSLSFLPILLSVSPAPFYAAAKAMSLGELYRTSPLGAVGMFRLGGVFSALFGMAAVYGAARGLSVAQITVFVGLIYVGGMAFQYPVGWLSDRMDRRILILATTAAGALAAFAAAAADAWTPAIYIAGLIIGGAANPLYSLLIAHTNDFLEAEDMPAASGGLIFLNGVGAIGGPLLVGAMMEAVAPAAFFAFVGALLGLVSLYAGWRMTRRPAAAVEETMSYTPVTPQASPVAVLAATEYDAEQAAEDEDEDSDETAENAA